MALSFDPVDGDTANRDGVLAESCVYDLLASSRRRVLLRYLDRNGGRAAFADATRAVAVAEGADPAAAPSEYKHVYVSLYQSHVPKLEQAGVVEHDREAKTLALTERAAPLFAHLELELVPPARRRTLVSRLADRLG